MCESGLISTLGKCVCFKSTVGSNPTISAIIIFSNFYEFLSKNVMVQVVTL